MFDDIHKIFRRYYAVESSQNYIVSIVEYLIPKMQRQSNCKEIVQRWNRAKREWKLFWSMLTACFHDKDTILMMITSSWKFHHFQPDRLLLAALKKHVLRHKYDCLSERTWIFAEARWSGKYGGITERHNETIIWKFTTAFEYELNKKSTTFNVTSIVAINVPSLQIRCFQRFS